MDDLWCSLDIAGLQSALAADPLWQPFPDSAAVSSIGAGDSNAYFGVADVDLMLSSPDEASNVMATDMDTTGFFGDDDGGRFLFQQHSSTSSSLSSKRSLSIDSGGSSQYQAPAPAAMAHHPSFPGSGDQDDEAIMRAMMAVMSASASPSSSASPSASSRPPHPFRRDDGSGGVHQGQAQAAAMALPQQLRGGNGGHVMVKSSLAMSPPEKTLEDPRTAGGNSGQQLYHMMSERKRREKLNDSFLTLRSLLPPCSKKDKTTVLTKAAGYLKALEAHVWELEEKKGKLERHIPASQEAAPAAPQQSRRAKVQISRSEEDVVNLTVMVTVECDVVELVLRVLECLRWMERVSVLSVDADTYSPKVLLKAIASIKLRIMDGCDWNEASFREAMTKAVNDATSSPPTTTTTTTTTSLPPCARVPLVVG